MSTTRCSGRDDGRHSTCRVWAGRPFFIRIGREPRVGGAGVEQRCSTLGHSRGSRSSTLVSSTTAGSVPGACGRPVSDRRTSRSALEPVRPRVAVAGARPDRVDASSAASARSSTRQVVSRAAPVGVHSSSSTGPPWAGAQPPREQLQHGGSGTGISPCAVGAVPPPSAIGRARAAGRSPRPANPAQTPTTSPIASCAPTSWKWTSSGRRRRAPRPRPRPAGRRWPAPARGPASSSSAPSSSARTSGQVRCGATVSAAATCARATAKPTRCTCSDAERRPVDRRDARERRPRMTSSRHARRRAARRAACRRSRRRRRRPSRASCRAPSRRGRRAAGRPARRAPRRRSRCRC